MPTMVPSRANDLFQVQVYKSFRLMIRKASTVNELQTVVSQISQHFIQWSQTSSPQDYAVLLHMAARRIRQLLSEGEK